MMPAVDPQSGISTAKVASRDPAGQGRRGSADDEAPVPPGTATLDVVSPRRFDARSKKFVAIGGGLAAAIVVGAIVSFGTGNGKGKGQKDEGAPGPAVRAASTGPATSGGPGARPEKGLVGQGGTEIAGAGTAAGTVAVAVKGPAAPVNPRGEGQPAAGEPAPSSGAERGQQPALPSAAREAEPAAGPEELEPFVVAVTTVPARAELELDGERVGRGRFRRSLPADHEKHVLRVSADGFEPRVLEFTDRPPPSKVVLVALPPAAEEAVTDEPSLIAPSPRRPAVRRPAEPPPSDNAPMNPNGAPVID